MDSIEKQNFYKELFSFAIPIGLQNLLAALIGATDALMLGRFSQDAAHYDRIDGISEHIQTAEQKHPNEVLLCCFGQHKKCRCNRREEEQQCQMKPANPD